MRVCKGGGAASRLSCICLLLAFLAGSSAFAPCRAELLPVDMAKAGDEAVAILQDYLKIDTSNPPGNEAKGASYLTKILKDNGFEPLTFETAAGRTGVFARLKGNGKKKALVLLHHIDVVPARAEDWSHPPFAGEVIKGEIWGRGTVDMKGIGVVHLETMLMLKRSGRTLDRDVIFLATPDEEVGGKFGAGWFVKNHADLLKDAEFLFNEAAFIDTCEDGRPRYCSVGVGEKSVLWLRLTTRGDAGHGSMPMPDSAINRLTRALAEIVAKPPAPTVLPPVREYFKRVSPVMGEPLKKVYADIDETVKNPELYREILKDKFKSSMLRNTVSPTVLKAGYKINVIPAQAQAELDCRLLPGVSSSDFVESIKKTVNDPGVQVEVVDSVHAPASAHETECFQAISRVVGRLMPGVPVVPMILPWFTDSHWFRELGICSYGFIPFPLDQEHVFTMHGKDERVPVESFKTGLKIMYAVLEELCIEKATGPALQAPTEKP